MRKKLVIFVLFSTLLNSSVLSAYSFDTAEDYTGEAFFVTPSSDKPSVMTTTMYEDEEVSRSSHTMPPIKKLRLKLKQRNIEKEQKIYELAPTASDVYTGEIGTSEYASKEITDDFQEMNPDGFEADDTTIEEINSKKKKKLSKKTKKNVVEDKESIILDCEKVDYDTLNYLVHATGNVSVEFVKQKITVKSDILTFDRMNNTIKAEGNVKILKSGKVITGDYIFVDMNEENALIENPITKSANIEIKSQKGYVYGDKIVQEKGNIVVKDSFPINFRSITRGPNFSKMLTDKKNTLTEDMNNGIINFKAKEIKITQEGEHEIISITKPRLYKGGKLVFKTPSVKLYTNKNHDYAETNHWEIGSIRGLGVYAGPGFVTKLPMGSVFKLMPMVNYKSGIGFGAVGRFSSGTNNTLLAYGTATERFLAYGKQELDDNLYLQYATNSYMQEWFLGRRRPKYGVSLVYEKGYGSENFLLKNQMSSFKHRFDFGYFHNLDFDGRNEKISTNNIGTTRFRYMAQATQSLYKYKNKEKLTAFEAGVLSQLSAGLYGTGDSQVIGRMGPYLHMQYKRWMQDIIYTFAAYEDNSPLSRYDAYRYGQQSLYLREQYKLCRWLALSWFGNINLSNDAPNGKTLQESSVYFSFGPDDVKFSLGYDFVRETLRFVVELMMDAKGTNVEYETLEIKQANKTNKKEEEKPTQKNNNKMAPVNQKILEKAVVENVKELEDVL